MLTAEGCQSRRKRLWDFLPGDCETLVLGDPQSLISFANYAPSPFVFRTSDATALLVLQPDKATLVADAMVKPFLDRAHVDDVVAPVWYDGKHSPAQRKSLLMKTAEPILSRLVHGPFGAETSSVPAGVLDPLMTSRPERPVLPLEPWVRAVRRAKDPDELVLIRRSVQAGEAGHAAALREIRPGMTELEAFALVQKAATKAAGEPVIVYGDFVSGPRCETQRGGPPTTRVIAAGDLFLLDFSVIIHGYRADFTNTFAVARPPTPRQRDLFAACVGALNAGEVALKPGAPGRAVDRAVRGHFAALGLDGFFPTHSGHGLGLSHPEPPFFVPESEDLVEPGDVVAIEPGLYVPGVGGMRFERNYLIQNDGPVTLTHHQISLEP